MVLDLRLSKDWVVGMTILLFLYYQQVFVTTILMVFLISPKGLNDYFAAINISAAIKAEKYMFFLADMHNFH